MPAKRIVRKSSKKSLMRRLKKQKGGSKMMKDLIKKVRKEIRTEKQLEKIMLDSIILEAEMRSQLSAEIKQVEKDIKNARALGKESKFKAISERKVKELECQKKMLKKFLANLKKGGRKRRQKGGARKQRGGAALSAEELKKFAGKVELEEYEADAEDDYGLELYDELVEQGKAYDICRQKIGKRYIYDTFNNRNADGFMASIKGEIVGFIIYYKRKDHLYLDLVCTAKNEKTKGIPLGQILIAKMEDYAKKSKIPTIKAHAVTPALPFYKSTGWKVTGAEKDDKHPIEKSMGVAKSVAKKPAKKVVVKKSVAVKKAPKKAPAKKKKGFFARLFSRKK